MEELRDVMGLTHVHLVWCRAPQLHSEELVWSAQVLDGVLLPKGEQDYLHLGISGMGHEDVVNV